MPRFPILWRLLLPCLALALSASTSFAAQQVVPGPDPGTRRFGTALVLLPNGNLLVRDPEWGTSLGKPEAGAVFLLDPDGNPISRLVGARAGDRIGSGGIVLLAGGDFVVSSPQWNAGDAIAGAGAVTFGNAASGFGAASVEVDAGNSLVGSRGGDLVGGDGVYALPNGAYVVASGDWDSDLAADAGAVTWCAADGSTVGAVDAGNSLVGASASDRVGGATVTGKPGVVVLEGGDYVVASPRWDRGAVADAGAVTWVDGDAGLAGVVAEANSLVGVRTGDSVGAEVLALRNGHYVVLSPYWRSATVASAGAATWADGTQPTIGEVSAANSLTGSVAGDLVGQLGVALANGNYVIASPLWDNGAVPNAGAVTWRDGSGPHPGVVDEGNSLVGTHPDDNLGYVTVIGLPPLGVFALDDGDYLVTSPEWDGDDAANAGAVTWGDGSTGRSGPLTPANSLVGSHAGDRIGTFVLRLEGGRYVVASPYWWQNRGAATYGDGEGAPTGVLDGGNSLVGSQQDDYVSASGLYRLVDGGYAVASERWSLGETLRVGAVTRAGATGISGEVSAANSLTGTGINDQVGRGGVAVLADGDYVVRSSLAGAGALTRVGPGHVSYTGEVTVSNSMVGVVDEDAIGLPGPTAFADGTLLQHTATGAANQAGAITLFDSDEPFTGVLPEAMTVRSDVAQGGAGLTWIHDPANRRVVVGDPLGNRIVMLSIERVFRNGFE